MCPGRCWECYPPSVRNANWDSLNYAKSLTRITTYFDGVYITVYNFSLYEQLMNTGPSSDSCTKASLFNVYTLKRYRQMTQSNSSQFKQLNAGASIQYSLSCFAGWTIHKHGIIIRVMNSLKHPSLMYRLKWYPQNKQSNSSRFEQSNSRRVEASHLFFCFVQKSVAARRHPVTCNVRRRHTTEH